MSSSLRRIRRDLGRIDRLVEILMRRVAEAIPPGSAPPRPRGDRGDRVLDVAASAGIASMSVKFDARGWLEVALPHGTFDLPPLLGQIFNILFEAPPDVDGFTGWVSRKSMLAALKNRHGRVLGRHALAQAVFRLKDVLLEDLHLNPRLIRQSRAKGYRLLFLSRPEASPGARGRRE
jgi:hypothetical protein